MVEIDGFLLGWILFVLVLIRCSGLAVFAPFFGAEHFPAQARVFLAAFIALALFPAVAGDASLPPRLDMATLGILALQELSIGLLLGFLTSLVFMGVQLAGELSSQQIGFSMANLIDPLSDTEIPILGFLKINLTLMLFLAANLHLVVIYVLRRTFDWMPIGGFALGALGSRPLQEELSYHATRLLIVGLQLSMPILLIMLLETVVEGFITRTMPQMNITVLGMPLRVILGMLALFFLLPALGAALVDPHAPADGILGESLRDVDATLQRLPASP